MPNFISEDNIEQAAIKMLVEANGYNSISCMTAEPETLPDGSGRTDKKQVVLCDVLLKSLIDINPGIPKEVIEKTADELAKTPLTADLMQMNYQNYPTL